MHYLRQEGDVGDYCSNCQISQTSNMILVFRHFLEGSEAIQKGSNTPIKQYKELPSNDTIWLGRTDDEFCILNVRFKGSFMGADTFTKVKQEETKQKIKPHPAQRNHSHSPEQAKLQDKKRKKSPSETRRRRSQSSKESSKRSQKQRNSKRSPKRNSKKSPKRSPIKPNKRSPTNKKSPSRKSPTRKSPSRRSLPKKRSPAKRSPAKRSPAKRSPVKRSPVRKSPAKRSPAKKSPGKRISPTKKIQKRSQEPKRKEKGKKEELRKPRSRSRNSTKDMRQSSIKNGKKHKKIEEPKVDHMIEFNNDRLSSESVKLSPPQAENGIEEGQINELIRYDIEQPKLDIDEDKMKLLPLVRTYTEETPTKSMQIIKSGKVLFTTGSHSVGKGVISIQRSNVATVPSLSSRLIIKKQ